MATNNLPITLTINATQAASGLGRTMLYQQIKEGRLKTVSVGRRRLVLYASLLELLGAGAETPGEAHFPRRRGRPPKKAYVASTSDAA